MNLTLRKVALGLAVLATAAAVAQQSAVEPTVTQKWIYSGSDLSYAGGACRTGNGWGGKVFVANGAKIQSIDANGVTDVYTHGSALNRGISIDDAGNILAMVGWPPGAGSWAGGKCDKFILLKSSDNYASATKVTVTVPTTPAYTVGGSYVFARSIGDFTSEAGGLFYYVANAAKNPMPIVIANSQGVQLPKGVTAEFSAANTMATAVPSVEKMSDLAGLDDVANTFYYRTGSAHTQIGYVDAEGKAAYLKVPTSLPAGWSLQTQNGFDVFTLGAHTYQIRMAGPTVWTNQFVISDETGNVVFHSDYTGEYAISNAKTGSGCNIVARKVSPYKVEIYQVYLTSGTDKCFAAMYEMTIPEPERPSTNVYLAGQIQGWDPQNALEFDYADGKYTLAYEGDWPQGFKLSTAKGDWTTFENAGFHIDGTSIISTGNTYNLADGTGQGEDANIKIAKGTYVFTVDLAARTLTVTGEEYQEPFEAPELYVRGSFNGWDLTAPMTTDGEVVDGYVTYTWQAHELSGAFKIGTADWNISLGSYADGGLAVDAAGAYTLQPTTTGGDITADLYKPQFTLRYPAKVGDPVLTVACMSRPAPMEGLNPFAYDVRGSLGDNNTFNVNFKATAAATSGRISFYDSKGNNILNHTLGSVDAGENSEVVDLTYLPNGEYTWAVTLNNNTDRTNPEVMFTAPASWANEGAKNYKSTGAAVVITDPESDAYGYIVVGHGHAQGYAVFDPTGTQIANPDDINNLFHVGERNASNGSSTSRGDALGGLAVFADWSDAYSGYWIIDPLDPAAPMRNMLMVDGATQAANGTVTVNGIATGSGSPCVAFQGSGDATKMYAFDEDIYGNTLVRYHLGLQTSIMEAPELVLSAYKGKMINTNIEIEPVEQGFFVSQNRANGAEASVPGLMFFDNDGTLLWTGENMGMPSFAGGVAVSCDGKLMANAGYDGYIRISELTFTEEPAESPGMSRAAAKVTPSFTTKYEINLPNTGANSSSWMQLAFDPAGNLHAFSRTGTGYTVVALPSSSATTPAKAAFTFQNSTGIEGIEVGADGAPARFFNLQGVEVPADRLAPGIYIRRQGSNSSKVVIR